MSKPDDEIQNLSSVIDRLSEKVRPSDAASNQTILEPVVGETIEVTILCVDAAGHSEMMKAYSSEFPSALARYQEITKRCVREYLGRDWHWAGDGCICAFWGERRRERAVLAGLKLLHEIMLFNLDLLKNPLPAPLKLRMAANDGPLNFRKPEGEINAVVINEASKLESKRTRAGEFNIYESVYYALDSRLKDVFSLVDDGFRSQRVFTYTGLKRDEQLSDVAIEEMFKSATSLLGNITNTTQALLGDWLDKDSASSLYGDSRQFYHLLDQFRASFRALDPRWSAKYRRWLVSKTVQFATLEESLWRELKRVFQRAKPGPDASEEFQILRSLFMNTHADQEVALQRLRVDLERLHGAEDTAVSTEERITKLLAADDFDRIAAFVSLIDGGLDALIPYLSGNAGDSETFRQLSLCLWGLADMLLIEEHNHVLDQAKKGTFTALKPLTSLLSSNGFVGEKFQVLLHFMEERPAQESLIIRKFRSMKIEPNFLDAEIVHRAIVAAHTSVGMRFQAAEAIDFPSFCLLATYPRTPLMSIWVLAERVAGLQSADVKMIFFDCVHPVLKSSLESEHWARDIDVIGNIIITLFKYEIFIEDSYFRDLEAILAHYRARAKRVRKDISMEAFSSVLDSRAVKGKQPDHLLVPTGLESLPIAVMRHLAKNGAHPHYFACYSEEPRISLEAVRYFSEEATVTDLVEYCEKYNVVPCSEFMGALSPNVRKTVLEGLEHKAEKPGNAALERELKRRLSKTDLEWLRTQRRRST